jgi:lysozyme
MKTNAEGMEIIRRHESFQPDPYLCPAGVWTIGYGSTKGVNEHTPPVTREQGEDLLRLDVAAVEGAVTRMVSVPLNVNQFSALVSFTFNVGAGAFRGSTLRALVNRKAFLEAADEFPRWNRGGGRVLGGLTKRRAEERALFLKPVLVAMKV